MSRILVTGGAGFIGSYLCARLLSEGHSVVSIDNMKGGSPAIFDKNVNHQNFVSYVADLHDECLMEDIFSRHSFDFIFHLASNTSVRDGQNNIDLDHFQTFGTTLQSLKFAAKYGIKKFFFASSSCVYGQQNTAFSEDSPLLPKSVYGAAKLAAEAYVNAFSELHDMQVWILRFCNIAGPDTTHGILKDISVKMATNPEQLKLLGNGLQEKPFLYIDDLIDGVMTIVKKATEKRNLFLLGNKDTITVKRIAEIAIEEYGKNTTLSFNNAKVSWPGDVTNYSYNISKAESLGWCPKYNSEDTIRKSIKLSLSSII